MDVSFDLLNYALKQIRDADGRLLFLVFAWPLLLFPPSPNDTEKEHQSCRGDFPHTITTDLHCIHGRISPSLLFGSRSHCQVTSTPCHGLAQLLYRRTEVPLSCRVADHGQRSAANIDSSTSHLLRFIQTFHVSYSMLLANPQCNPSNTPWAKMGLFQDTNCFILVQPFLFLFYTQTTLESGTGQLPFFSTQHIRSFSTSSFHYTH